MSLSLIMVVLLFQAAHAALSMAKRRFHMALGHALAGCPYLPDKPPAAYQA